MRTLLTLLFVCSLTGSFAQNVATAPGSEPFVLGRIDRLQSTVLSEERVLNIYLPEGYNATDSTTYPVVYLLDGSADEDFIHIAGLLQFVNFPWVNIYPKSILVGIANVDRRRDFTFPTSVEADKKEFPATGGSEKFILFIESELQPFINKTYHTNTHRTIIGQSLGGLLAAEILLKKPEMFDHYVIVSPSLWWNKESLLAVEQQFAKQRISIYIAVGKEGEQMEDDAARLNTMLRARPNNFLVSFQQFPKQDHGNILHKAVNDAFECFGKK